MTVLSKIGAVATLAAFLGGCAPQQVASEDENPAARMQSATNEQVLKGVGVAAGIFVVLAILATNDLVNELEKSVP